jgi:hypothetical protein
MNYSSNTGSEGKSILSFSKLLPEQLPLPILTL